MPWEPDIGEALREGTSAFDLPLDAAPPGLEGFATLQGLHFVDIHRVPGSLDPFLQLAVGGRI